MQREKKCTTTLQNYDISIFFETHCIFYTLIIHLPRAPKLEDKDESGNRIRQKGFRPLYDIPFMFDAREFLRKKVIGHSVQVQFSFSKCTVHCTVSRLLQNKFFRIPMASERICVQVYKVYFVKKNFLICISSENRDENRFLGRFQP